VFITFPILIMFYNKAMLCRFDEQMIKSLFAYNLQGSMKDEEAMNKTASTTKHVIEHHRLQNTTILLKTLNANTSQVCNSVIQGRFHDVLSNYKL
jgi:hypothetical protein